MPYVNGKLITPDEAIAKGLCPETGVDLRTVNPIAQLNRLWQTAPKDDRRGAEALRRRELLQNFIKEHNVRTSNMPKPQPAKAPTA
jgi:hypothetical protein